MSQKQVTLSKNYNVVFNQVRDNTPEAVIELIAKQLDRAEEAAGRIEKEGSVVRDARGSVIAHPAINIEIAATKLASDMIGKNRCPKYKAKKR